MYVESVYEVDICCILGLNKLKMVSKLFLCQTYVVVVSVGYFRICKIVARKTGR